ncbi:hypothetical protein BCR43DRAFT_471384 [Syncephalastrum racemosum]|uniref:Oxidoreductase AflY n=1 Tax=Syncephalastrum racemosum TaxID=13706 RepID=A0A1X2HIR8_SYNRA|nr:hypothetical protein BCR43DRAFT_471384 [Syncephalastrum racemosum]
MSTTPFRLITPAKASDYALVLPGISPASRKLAEDLLLKNHREHNIFFNEKGFHNHLTHHFLAAYSWGASPQRLQQIYDSHASYQRQMPPLLKHELTRSNFQSDLGKREAYASYLRLFSNEIENNGMIPTIRRYVFSGDMLSRTLGGAFHPIIHLGYAVEFDLPGLAAEGLAMATCTEARFSQIPKLQSAQDYKIPAPAANAASTARDMMSQVTNEFASRVGFGNKDEKPKPIEKDDVGFDLQKALESNPILKLANAIREDKELDGIVTYDNPNKFDATIQSEVATKKVKEAAGKWTIQENPAGVQQGLKDLYTAAMMMLGASGIRGGDIKFDFFLMHALTSIHAIHTLLPHLTPREGVLLLQGHAIATLTYFISRGRPQLRVDEVLNYRQEEKEASLENPWFDIFDRSIRAEEPHTIKVARACALGQIIYGHDKFQASYEKAWLNVARMNLEVDGEWFFGGVGFDESWEK